MGNIIARHVAVQGTAQETASLCPRLRRFQPRLYRRKQLRLHRLPRRGHLLLRLRPSLGPNPRLVHLLRSSTMPLVARVKGKREMKELASGCLPLTSPSISGVVEAQSPLEMRQRQQSLRPRRRMFLCRSWRRQKRLRVGCKRATASSRT